MYVWLADELACFMCSAKLHAVPKESCLEAVSNRAFRRYPGLYGTAAVLLGYFLHTPALGNFHWDYVDALWGVKLAVPLILLGACSC